MVGESSHYFVHRCQYHRKIRWKLTDEFSIRVGLHQGSVLSPLLFAVVMDMIAKEVDCCLPWNVLYAAVLVVMAESQEALVRILMWKKVSLEVSKSERHQVKSHDIHRGWYLSLNWKVSLCNLLSRC